MIFLSKQSSIFHNNIKYSTNNKNTFSTFEKVDDNNDISFDKDSIINFFNKRITIELKSGDTITGVLLSKRNNVLLLDSGDYINLKDILSIK